MNSQDGSLNRAVELLDQAAGAAPYDHSIKHSKAELQLRLADIARTPLEKEQRLREAKRIASTIRDSRPARDSGSHALHTIVKIDLKKLEDVLDSTESTVTEEVISTRIRLVEDSLLDGLQRFPDDPYLLTSEAKLATLLKDSARAIIAMRSAFKTDPRNGVIAVRLAKSLEASGDTSGARAILKTGLDNSPGNKKLHYALAKFTMCHEPQAADQIEYHLQRSFTNGDTNYDAQLLYARQLYIKGDVSGAKERFRSLALARVGLDTRDQMRYPLDGWFSGRVVRLEATYCFVARDGIADWVFTHRSKVDTTLWVTLRVGTRVRFHIAFTMKGAAAADLMLETEPLTKSPRARRHR